MSACSSSAFCLLISSAFARLDLFNVFNPLVILFQLPLVQDVLHWKNVCIWITCIISLSSFFLQPKSKHHFQDHFTPWEVFWIVGLFVFQYYIVFWLACWFFCFAFLVLGLQVEIKFLGHFCVCESIINQFPATVSLKDPLFNSFIWVSPI